MHIDNFSLFLQGIETDQTDLRRDTAFNLSLIYHSSGNTRMAQKMLYTYAVVWWSLWQVEMMPLVLTLASCGAGGTSFVCIFFWMSKTWLVLYIVCMLYIDFFYFWRLNDITYGWKQFALRTRLTNIDELLDLWYRIEQWKLKPNIFFRKIYHVQYYKYLQARLYCNKEERNGLVLIFYRMENSVFPRLFKCSVFLEVHIPCSCSSTRLISVLLKSMLLLSFWTC